MNNEQNPNASSGAGDVYSQRYAHQNPDGSDYSTSQYQSAYQTGSGFRTEQAAGADSGADSGFSAGVGANPYSGAGAGMGSAPASEPYAYSYEPAYSGSHAAEAAKPKMSGGKIFLISFAGALVAFALVMGVLFGFGVVDKGSSSTVNIGSTTGTSVNASDVDETLPEAVAEKCLPSVASINVYGVQQSSASSLYDYLYGNGGNSSSNELTQLGLGSGVVLSDDGYIVTNNHVVESGQKYEVTINGDQYEAELVGADASSDVAVLKVTNGGEFTPIELGDSDNITIGEWVMSIGSPFGLEQSVATGIVSATSRSQIMDSSTDALGNSTGETTIYPNMIQTDAAINPGNSGGALVDSDGKLIGINTLITSYSGNYSGVGFAIPSNYAINLAQSIISGEDPTHAQLGIAMTTINSSIAQRYGFSVDSGAYVSSVTEGSAAANAGIEVGDIITKFDGEDVSSASDVMLDVRTKNPGDKVVITVDRGGQSMDFDVTLGESDSSSSSASTQKQNSLLR